MAIKLYQEPELRDPVLLAAWPGIGNIGIIVVETLRQSLNAEELGEIEPWEFFYPRRVVIKHGEMQELEFPVSKFYFKRLKNRDLIFFIGDEQPAEPGHTYAEGQTAYNLANLVLDVAVRFGSRRIYTSGAAVAPVHHLSRPRVWAVPNNETLIPEIRSYENTVLMSDIEGLMGQGNITGLNGLLLGVAHKRGLEAICLMGEIPVYLQAVHIPYPKASRSVLESFARSLDIPLDLSEMDGSIVRSGRDVENIFQSFPEDIRQQIDRLKPNLNESRENTISEEDKRNILDEIDRFLNEPKED